MKKYLIGNHEIHLPSDNEYVAVCWNGEWKRQTIYKEESINFFCREEKFVRRGKPFIRFVLIRGEPDDYWLDDNSPVEGGFGLEMSSQIIDELEEAHDYLFGLLHTKKK